MSYHRCNGPIEEGEPRQLHGKILCEDCYIEALSPGKAFYPWAVYSAKSFSQKEDAKIETTEIQSKILQLLKKGPEESTLLAQKLHISISDFERELATLRHMELIIGELQEGRKIIRLW